MKQTVFKKLILIFIICLLIALGVFVLYKGMWPFDKSAMGDGPVPYSRGPSGPPVIGEPTLPLPE